MPMPTEMPTRCLSAAADAKAAAEIAPRAASKPSGVALSRLASARVSRRSIGSFTQAARALGNQRVTKGGASVTAEQPANSAWKLCRIFAPTPVSMPSPGTKTLRTGNPGLLARLHHPLASILAPGIARLDQPNELGDDLAQRHILVFHRVVDVKTVAILYFEQHLHDTQRVNAQFAHTKRSIEQLIFRNARDLDKVLVDQCIQIFLNHQAPPN